MQAARSGSPPPRWAFDNCNWQDLVHCMDVVYRTSRLHISAGCEVALPPPRWACDSCMLARSGALCGRCAPHIQAAHRRRLQDRRRLHQGGLVTAAFGKTRCIVWTLCTAHEGCISAQAARLASPPPRCLLSCSSRSKHMWAVHVTVAQRIRRVVSAASHSSEGAPCWLPQSLLSCLTCS